MDADTLAAGVVLMQEECRNRLGRRKGSTIGDKKNHTAKLRLAWMEIVSWLCESQNARGLVSTGLARAERWASNGALSLAFSLLRVVWLLLEALREIALSATTT